MNKTNHIRTIALITLIVCAAQAEPLTSPAILDTQHVDFYAVYSAEDNSLGLVARDDGADRRYEGHESVLVVAEGARIQLQQASPPFGDADDDFWMLPMSPAAGLLYLGTSGQSIPQNLFQGDRLSLQLVAVNGPGHFFVWQPQAGNLNIKMNTRDGITGQDSHDVLAGFHDHVAWGFTEPGTYCITFVLSGTRVGETTPIVSPETTFRFHVEPLSPFEQWQFEYWPFASCDPVAEPEADPDEDGVVNLMEYALGLDPNVSGTDGLPQFAWVFDNGTRYGALTFTRVKSATDIEYAVVVSDQVIGTPWEEATEVAGVINQGDTQEVTIRDSVPAAEKPQRFLRLEVTR